MTELIIGSISEEKEGKYYGQNIYSAYFNFDGNTGLQSIFDYDFDVNVLLMSFLMSCMRR